MKKLLALLLVTGLLTVIGCGGAETKKDTKVTPSGTTQSEKKTGP